MSEPTKVKESAVGRAFISMPHLDCEDCWYSCSMLTCDPDRKSAKCDCGAHAVNEELDRLRERVAELAEVLRSMTSGLADHLKAGTVRCDSCADEVEQARAILAKERP